MRGAREAGRLGFPLGAVPLLLSAASASVSVPAAPPTNDEPLLVVRGTPGDAADECASKGLLMGLAPCRSSIGVLAKTSKMPLLPASGCNSAAPVTRIHGRICRIIAMARKYRAALLAGIREIGGSVRVLSILFCSDLPYNRPHCGTDMQIQECMYGAPVSMQAAGLTAAEAGSSSAACAGGSSRAPSTAAMLIRGLPFSSSAIPPARALCCPTAYWALPTCASHAMKSGMRSIIYPSAERAPLQRPADTFVTYAALVCKHALACCKSEGS